MNFRYTIDKIIHNHNFRHGALYSVFSFINSGISFVLLLILAKFLLPEDYGKLNLITTFITIVSLLITLCSNSYIGICFFQKTKDELQKVIQASFTITTMMLFFLAALLLIFPVFIEKCVGVPIQFLWLSILICYFSIFNNVNLDIWRLEEKPVSYGIYSISFAVTNFILTFILIVKLKQSWEGRVYAWFILGIIYFIISLIFLLKRKYLVISKFSLSIFTETLIYALPILPHSASFWLKQGMDRYIINYFHEQAAVGYYSFAMNLSAIIGIVGTAFNATNSVYIYKNLINGYHTVRNTLRKQTVLMTGAFFIISIIVGFFAWLLISLFINKYNFSIRYIFPLCIGGFFQCIYLLWVNYLFFYKKTKKLMYITLVTALIQLSLSIWLTRFSILWTAYISMVVQILTTFLVWHYSKKTLYQQNLEKNN